MEEKATGCCMPSFLIDRTVPVVKLLAFSSRWNLQSRSRPVSAGLVVEVLLAYQTLSVGILPIKKVLLSWSSHKAGMQDVCDLLIEVC